MSRIVVISLTYTLVLLDVHGQYGIRRYRVRFSDNQPFYYHGDTIQCTGVRRRWYPFFDGFSDRYEIAEEGNVDIVIQQYLTNGTFVELTSCPFSNGYRCSAHLIDDGCREVNVACSVTKNETKLDRVTREIVMTSRPSIKTFHIHYKNVNSDNYTQVFPPGSLIELICSGDVSIVKRKVYENLTFRWKNGFVKMQDPTTIKTTSISDEKCKTEQTVSAFLYLKDEQLDTEINCQTTYWPSFWRGTTRKSINIKTIPERNQILGPVVVITDELEDRSLHSLTCKTTTDILNSTEDIQWCIRKENNTQYVPLPLQEDPNIETFNRSTEKTIKSSVLYQLLKSDENVEIICETNHSKNCGSGTLRGTILLNSEPIKAQNLLQNFTNVTLEQSNQLDNKCPTTDELNIMLYASAGVMTAGIIILVSGLFAFCKAKKKVKKETSTSFLNAAVDKSNMPKANEYNLTGNNPVSHEHQNQISSGGQTYSNAPVHTGGTTIGVYELTNGSNDGDMYEPIEVNDYDPHVYEGKLQTDEVYEEV